MKRQIVRACAGASLLLGLLAACSGEPAPAATSATPPAAQATPAPSAAPATAEQPSAVPAAEAQPATRLDLRSVQEAGKQFGLHELEIDTDGVAINPFDPAQFDLHVRFTAPSGETILVPAFSYQDFDPQTLRLNGRPVWRARFTPAEPGEWHAQAELTSPKLASQPLGFAVAADPSARGFVRINQQNPRYLAFDDGSFYFPIGLNLGWASQPNLGVLSDYRRWLDRLSQNGGNVGRVWMASWSFGIEWNDTGLGDYSGRMKQAWLLDQVFKLAEERGVYIMLTLLNHGAFSTSVNPEWDDNPYNIANGGPLKEPRLFARNAEARELFKRRVRYIAARWGYSPNLFAWEWWNEVNWTPIDDASLKPWITEMTAHIQQYDPYDHLVSSSYAGAGGSTALWAMPELDFVQLHDYTGNDPAKLLPLQYQVMSPKYSKPILLAEYGYSADGASAQPGQDVVHFHNGLWAAPFSGMSSTAMYWWWDTLVDPHNLWAEYKGIATFLKDENLAALAPAKPQQAPEGATVLALQGQDRALAWVRSNAYDVAAASAAYRQARQAGQAGAGWAYQPAPIEGLQLTITGLADGAYTARWYSPKTFEWQPEQAVQVRGGTATLAAPAFAQDLAVKIVAAK
jgi:hypothetical protein